MNSDKIRSEHLSRRAFVYVRQSSLGQVRHHRESGQRQYDLEQHARTLGWADVVVVDDDQGKSGSTAAGRPGFQRMVAEVSLGRVGAVLGLEVSRLARNNRDWYQLLDLCGLMNTLIVDAEGVYDPRVLNDRLLLGLNRRGRAQPPHRLAGPRAGGNSLLDRRGGVAGQQRHLLGHRIGGARVRGEAPGPPQHARHALVDLIQDLSDLLVGGGRQRVEDRRRAAARQGPRISSIAP
jgi:hypothetical protein